MRFRRYIINTRVSPYINVHNSDTILVIKNEVISSQIISNNNIYQSINIHAQSLIPIIKQAHSAVDSSVSAFKMIIKRLHAPVVI